jgi:hypothetical protein
MFRYVPLAFLVLVAGCAGGGGAGTTTPSPPIRAAATPATLDAPGYAERRADAPWVNTTITARIEGDVTLQTTREVRARTARRVYARSMPAGPAVVALYAVPSVKPFDNADLRKNPAAGLTPAELLTRAQTVYGVRDLSATGERSVTVLDAEATLTHYRGTGSANGTDRSVTAAVVTVAHGADYVTVAVVTPRGRDAPLDRLLRAVRHKKGAEPR